MENFSFGLNHIQSQRNRVFRDIRKVEDQTTFRWNISLHLQAEEYANQETSMKQVASTALHKHLCENLKSYKCNRRFSDILA
jgi:hypothetical protein